MFESVVWIDVDRRYVDPRIAEGDHFERDDFAYRLAVIFVDLGKHAIHCELTQVGKLPQFREAVRKFRDRQTQQALANPDPRG